MKKKIVILIVIIILIIFGLLIKKGQKVNINFKDEKRMGELIDIVRSGKRLKIGDKIIDKNDLKLEEANTSITDNAMVGLIKRTIAVQEAKKLGKEISQEAEEHYAKEE